MSKREIVISGSSITIEEFGSGKELLICFNGYGRVANEMKIWSESLVDKYSVVAVNLHLHDDSFWEVNEISIGQFCHNLITEIGWNGKPFDVLGYSIGARIAMRVAFELDSFVDNIILFAPDGVYDHFLFRFVNNTVAGKNLFKFLVKRPKLAFLGLSFCKIVGVYKKETVQYYYNRFNTLEKRNKLNQVWRVLSEVSLRNSEKMKLFSNEKFRWLIVLGENDNVISSKKVKNKTRSIVNLNVTELPVGHSFLIKKINLYLKDLLH